MIVIRAYIFILTLLLQGCFGREAQPQTLIAPYRVPEASVNILGLSLSSTTDDISLDADSQKARQRAQTWPEEKKCQFVQRGFFLTKVLVEINGMDILEIIESMPEGFLDSPLYQKDFPVEFYIDSNMPEELIEPIDEVFSEWNVEVEFEAFTIKGIYDNPNIITSKDQVDEADRKNVIYWVMPENESIFGAVETETVGAVETVGARNVVGVGRVLPSYPLNFIDNSSSFLPLNETNVFINGEFFNIFQEDVIQTRREELVEHFRRGIIFFEKVLKHEMGHTLGLANIYKDDIDITAQDQIPLMWYNIEEGIDINNLESYFDSPLEVDSYVLDALSCAYDLEVLREQGRHNSSEAGGS